MNEIFKQCFLQIIIKDVYKYENLKVCGFIVVLICVFKNDKKNLKS
jgi:hypothetical protein